MRKYLWLVGLASLAVFATSKPGFSEEKNEIGLGLVLGRPSGVNAQFFWTKRSAVDFTAAWWFHDWFFAAADYQVYDYILDSPREWRWYYGGGAFMATGLGKHRSGEFGLRIPLGIRYGFRHSPLEIWGEVAPGLRLIDRTEPELQGGIGLTFWIR